MTWNWQQPEWPDFTWDAATLEGMEKRFLHQSGVIVGAMAHTSEEEKQQLTIEVISNEAYKTSEIEGEILDRQSLQSSIRRHFGLSAEVEGMRSSEEGIADMMMDLYRSYAQPLTHQKLIDWHGMLMQGRRDLTDIGAYRTHEDAMQVVSGRLDKPTVHFEAPPSAAVPAEMDRFLTWFNESETTLPPLTRAGVAHLYFECIHPFEDGNGRVGRAISEMALSQALERPTLLALSHTIEGQKKAYYDALARNNQRLEITDWLRYFALTVLDAQSYTEQLIAFLIEKTKLFDRLRGRLNSRQEKVLLRMFREGLSGFKGGLSAENYMQITKASPSTATRDLQDMVSNGVLVRHGERRHTRYVLNVPPVNTPDG